MSLAFGKHPSVRECGHVPVGPAHRRGASHFRIGRTCYCLRGGGGGVMMTLAVMTVVSLCVIGLLLLAP